MSVDPLTIESNIGDSVTNAWGDECGAAVPVTVTRRTARVDDLIGATRISDPVPGSCDRGADMTLINAANLHTAVPGWGLDTLSLVGIPEPTLDDLEDLDAFDDMLLVDMLLADSPELVYHEVAFHDATDLDVFDHTSRLAAAEPARRDLSELDTFDDEPLGTRYARCSDGHGTLSHLFFSDDDFDIARAKAICSKCGLRASCLAGALERGEVAGVWGGELVEDGAVVVLKRRRGRPPKVARPVLVVDEVPVPPHMVA
jgi:WhiB family redox-sensing transcriptional regulator